MAADLQSKKRWIKEMENFDANNYNIPKLMIGLKKSVYPDLENVYDEL
jgi:hypothetical protein